MKHRWAMAGGGGHGIPGRKSRACLALTGLLTLSLLVPRQVRADDALPPPWTIGQGVQGTAARDIRQQPIVQVEVTVSDATQAALLRGQGYDCAVGACRLELPDGDERRLGELGLDVRPLARAIKVSAGTPQRSGAALGETYVYDENHAMIYIPDADLWGPGINIASPIDITDAPADAKVSRIVFTGEVAHDKVSDLVIGIGNLESGLVTLWDRYGGTTDNGLDDDAENDEDVFFSGRGSLYFNGDAVNQQWLFAARDWAWLNTGYIMYWSLYVYYWTCDLPGVPTAPSPANGAAEVSRDADLDWADSAGATSYDVYWGTTASPIPFLGTTTTSQYSLARMACGTDYYWRVVANNSCGIATGPDWHFATTVVPSIPASPSPANHATGVLLDADLVWAACSPATSYTVHWGTTIPPKNSTTTTFNSLALPSLNPNTHYYWSVVAFNGGCLTSGATWDFATGCVPAVPRLPVPADGATGVALDSDLDWADTPGAGSYEVYFGGCGPRPPPLVGTTSTSSYALPALSPVTSYCWRIIATGICGETAGPAWDFATLNPTPTPTLTSTPSATPSPTLSATANPALTRTPTGTLPPSATATRTQDVTRTATRTASRTPTLAPGLTPGGYGLYLPLLRR